MSDSFYTPPEEPLTEIDHGSLDTFMAIVGRIFIILGAIAIGAVIAWIIGVYKGWIPIFLC
jgi:ABC-type phosphate transport system permease subunit